MANLLPLNGCVSNVLAATQRYEHAVRAYVKVTTAKNYKGVLEAYARLSAAQWELDQRAGEDK